MYQIRLLTLAAASLLAAVSNTACAEDVPAASSTIVSNINLVSDYRFRGIDQTWGQPALQGGVDYTRDSGLYAGIWASNVSGNSYAGGNLELDYYAGYNGKISDDIGFTLGGYGYYYPGANYNKSSQFVYPSQSFDNFEVNAGVSWKWISYKLSVSTTDYFGANSGTGYTGDTKGTLYHDLSVNYPLMDDLTLGMHVGRTDVTADYVTGNGNISADYTDYKLSLAKTFTGGWNASVAYVTASNNTFFRPPVGGASLASSETRDLNKGVLIVQAGHTF
jgi:uncharacterized protein (TIGR02001 family)